MVYLFLAKSTMHLPHAINYAEPRPRLPQLGLPNRGYLHTIYLLCLTSPLPSPLSLSPTPSLSRNGTVTSDLCNYLFNLPR